MVPHQLFSIKLKLIRLLLPVVGQVEHKMRQHLFQSVFCRALAMKLDLKFIMRIRIHIVKTLKMTPQVTGLITLIQIFLIQIFILIKQAMVFLQVIVIYQAGEIMKFNTTQVTNLTLLKAITLQHILLKIFLSKIVN